MNERENLLASLNLLEIMSLNGEKDIPLRFAASLRALCLCLSSTLQWKG